MQDTRTPMTIAIGQNVLNILLSLFLVVVLHLGIVGVAIGTLVSQWAAFVAALLRYKSWVKCGYISNDEAVSKSNHTNDEAVSKFKQHTRNYAKRQLSWFRADKNINWFFIDETDEEIIIGNIIRLCS